MSPYPRIRVEGSARERGREHGDQARERVRRSIAGYAATFAHYAGWDWATVTAAAARFEAPIAAFHPASVEEMRGIAEGAGVRFADVLALNVRTEVMFAAKAREYGAAARVPVECTAVAALGGASGGGRTLVAQNWDWLLHALETVVVLEVEQPDAPSFVTVVEAGLLAKMGMNGAGLGVATNALVSADDQGRPGVPYHVVLRALLHAGAVPAPAHASTRSAPRWTHPGRPAPTASRG
jgi:isopenicillin-N N-acyltransferase-like protein